MKTLKSTPVKEFLFYLTVFFAISLFALLQPFGAPPDEVNRYKVTQFICNYGFLPTGEEWEVAIGGYGGSYAFQPILPYIFQGIVTGFLSKLSVQEPYLLLAARFVNVFFGVTMAVYIRKLSRLLFSDTLSGWLFCFLIMFLPQNLFLHSYVNTDSCASLSGAMILFACLSGWQRNWHRSDCITLCLGVIFCALSYYNAYGLIVAGALLFFFSFFHRQTTGNFRKRNMHKWRFDCRFFFQKGLPVAIGVLLGAGWWFLRNYAIHDGDFLGLTARMENAALTALPEYNPLTRITVQGSGVSLWEMLRTPDFFYYLWNSFVARFGPMTLPTFSFLYIWYYRIFWVGFLCSLLPFQKEKTLPGFYPLQRLLFHVGMFTAALIPVGLCIYYSYTSDYQPQGRYIMPMLIPFMYFITLGFHKLAGLAESITSRLMKNPCALSGYLPFFIKGGLMCFLLLSLLLTLFGVVVPYYTEHGTVWNSAWIYY